MQNKGSSNNDTGLKSTTRAKNPMKLDILDQIK